MTALESRAVKENLFLKRAAGSALIYNPSQHPPSLPLSFTFMSLQVAQTPQATQASLSQGSQAPGSELGSI